MLTSNEDVLGADVGGYMSAEFVYSFWKRYLAVHFYQCTLE